MGGKKRVLPRPYPRPKPLTSARSLFDRVMKLHNDVETKLLIEKGLEATPDRLGMSRSTKTISIVEFEIDGEYHRIITTNNRDYYRILSDKNFEWRTFGEMLGSEPVYVTGNNPIHAEQIGVHDARTLGAQQGRIATSNFGCEICVDLLHEEYPGFYHVNPRPTRPPPPLNSWQRTIPDPAKVMSGKKAMGKGRKVGKGPKKHIDFALDEARGIRRDLQGTSHLIERIPSKRHLAKETILRASKRIAKRISLRTAGRFLISSLGKVIIAVLPILDVVDMALLAFDLYDAIMSSIRENEIQKAIQKALEREIPSRIQKNLKSYRNEIIRYYINEWEKKGGATFLYISPRIKIYNVVSEGNLHNFQVDFDINNLAKDFISTNKIKLDRKDIKTWSEADYEITVRWSLEQPLFTPLDVYLAKMEIITKMIVQDWSRIYISEQKPDIKLVKAYYEVVRECAMVTSTLRSDAYFGIKPIASPSERFNPTRSGSERWIALQRLGNRINKILIPRLDRLIREQAFDPSERIRLIEAEDDPLNQEIQMRFGVKDLINDLLQIASQMKGLNGSELDYVRLESLEMIENPIRALTRIAQFRVDGYSTELARFLDPVLVFLPTELLPQPTTADYFKDITPAESRFLLLEREDTKR